MTIESSLEIRMFKYGKPKDGMVEVVMDQTLSPQFYQKCSELISEQIEKVTDCEIHFGYRKKKVEHF
jgi:hypothetical protein